MHIWLCLLSYCAPPTPEIYTLSLHDALPIWISKASCARPLKSGTRISSRVLGETLRMARMQSTKCCAPHFVDCIRAIRSEEHTSELQSPMYLVCRLLLEKKKTDQTTWDSLQY